MAKATPRRTQEERSAHTRGRLIQAALDELMVQGYAGLTTSAIADRAQVSRGALTHHFASKEDLVVQAVEHMLHEATAEIRTLADSVAARRLPLDDFLDRLWEMFRGRLLLVTLEHVTAARHNPSLKARLVPVVREFHGALDSIWREFFRAAGLPAEEGRDLPQRHPVPLARHGGADRAARGSGLLCRAPRLVEGRAAEAHAAARLLPSNPGALA
jgi:AcrR family transcriptional regulator